MRSTFLICIGYKFQEKSGVKMGFKAEDPENREIGALDNKMFDIYDSRDGYSWLVLKAINQVHTDDGQTMDVQLTSDATPEVIQYIVEYLSKRDVLYVHFSVADREKLLEADKYPERYQDLVMRVTGFSARFVALPENTRQEIINRSWWN